MFPRTIAPALAVALLGVLVPAGAATSTVTPADKTFMQTAYSGGLGEVELGKLAQQKASSSQAKLFGQRMAADHTANAQQLASVASANGVTLSKAVAPDAKAEMTKLQGLSGTQFDRAYLSDMVKDHNKDIAAYEKAQKQTSNASLKSYITASLPTLRQHEQLAQTDASLEK